MQVAVIEYARNVLGLSKAHSSEFNPKTPDPVIGLVTEWIDRDGSVETRDENADLGGTMRLGAQTCKLVPGTRTRRAYGNEEINERHRHRYEFNNNYLSGCRMPGWSFPACRSTTNWLKWLSCRSPLVHRLPVPPRIHLATA